MKTYTVWFSFGGEIRMIFMSGVPGAELAGRIASNLVDEGFVTKAWFEEE